MSLHVVLLELAAGGADPVATQKRTARVALAHSAELAGLPLAPPEDLAKDERDAPVPSRGTCWTISHTGRWAAGLAATFPVGVDVERLRLPRERSREQIMRSALSPSDLDVLGRDSHEAVDARWWTLAWTAKEAALKATGLGLLGLGGCELLEFAPEPRTDRPLEVAARALVSSAGERFCVELRAPDSEHFPAVSLPLARAKELPDWIAGRSLPLAR